MGRSRGRARNPPGIRAQESAEAARATNPRGAEKRQFLYSARGRVLIVYARTFLGMGLAQLEFFLFQENFSGRFLQGFSVFNVFWFFHFLPLFSVLFFFHFFYF
jgi:hypothetical protein